MKASVRNAVYADSITTPMCVMLWWRQLCVLVAILLVSCVWDVRYRRNSQLQDLRDVGGGFNKLNYFIGRPRIRQVRSEPCGKDDALDLHTAFEESPIHNATCFYWDVDTPEDTNSFTTGTVSYVSMPCCTLFNALGVPATHDGWLLRTRWDYGTGEDVPDYPCVAANGGAVSWSTSAHVVRACVCVLVYCPAG